MLLTDCEVIASIGEQDYNFDVIDVINIEEPKTKTLTRGLNGKNKVGFVVRQNNDQPTVITATVKNLDRTTSLVLQNAYNNETRFDFNVVKSSDGNKCYAKNVILAEEPIQKSISNDAEAYNVDLIMHTFDYNPEYTTSSSDVQEGAGE